MKTPIRAYAPAALLITFLVACQSPRASRIQEHAALFASLDRPTQQIIEDGLFDHGFPPELVYMSLGKPNQVTKTQTDNGTVTVWKYRNFMYGNSGAVRLAANTPGSKPYGPILSANAPGGPSLFSTKAGPVQPTVSDGSDAPVGTLFIEFLNDRVVSARIDP